jgi:competence protein ComEC
MLTRALSFGMALIVLAACGSSADSLGEEGQLETDSTAARKPTPITPVATNPITIGNVTARTVSAVVDMPTSAPAAGAYRVHNIDLGTGLGILVQGNDFTMLFDGGSNDDAQHMNAKTNGNRLLAYLAAALGPSGPAECTPDGDGRAKVDHPKLRIDHIFLSHPHDDHVSMLGDVVRCYAIGDVWDAGDPYPSAAYADFLDAVSENGVGGYHTASSVPSSNSVTVSGTLITMPSSTQWSEFNENDIISLGNGATAKILHADGGSYPNDANLNSTVVRVDLGSTSMLLTGDAESGARLPPDSPPGAIEAKLLANHLSDLKVDILQVGHHGSMTSNRSEFLQAIMPTWALIGVGPRPYSGTVLPDASVIAALTALGPQILRTDVHDASGCPVADRIGLDTSSNGGCDNFVLDIN